MTYLMGIDGGGSNLRVAIVTPELTVHSYSQSKASVNPSLIGRIKATDLIQRTISSALRFADVPSNSISGVGIGIAGASATHSELWLRDVVSSILPAAYVAPSSDIEIALVGAHGPREGVLALAGTGSVAYGVNATGQSVQVGGWGYLMGDEGSGYWIGMEALQAITHAADGRAEPTILTERVLHNLHLRTEYDLIAWLYASEVNRTREIAALTPIVLEEATHGDVVSLRIVDEAASQLTNLCQTIIRRLHMEQANIAFAGGILESKNPLSLRLVELLGLSALPVPQYPPMVGAALLAKLQMEA